MERRISISVCGKLEFVYVVQVDAKEIGTEWREKKHKGEMWGKGDGGNVSEVRFKESRRIERESNKVRKEEKARQRIEKSYGKEMEGEVQRLERECLTGDGGKSKKTCREIASDLYRQNRQNRSRVYKK